MARGLPAHPESVPINLLVQVAGTPLADRDSSSIRSISPAPSRWRASPCRHRWPASQPVAEQMSDETQALCFLAGANSIFSGPKLLTTPNPEHERDWQLFDRLGMAAMPG